MPSTIFTQLWTMFRKDVKLVYRNPIALGLLVVMPFVLIAVMSTALSPVFEGASSFRVHVVDLDQSPESERLLAELDSGPALELVPRDWNRSDFTVDDADSIFDESRKNFVVLVVPQGFGTSVIDADPIPLTLFSDPVQSGFSDIVLQELRSRLLTAALLNAFSRVLVEDADLSETEAIAVVQGSIDPLVADPDLKVIKRSGSETRALPSNFEQTVPGFSVMFTFWLAAIIASSIYVEKRVFGTWRRTLASPVPRWSIVVSRIAAYVVLGLTQMIVLFSLGWAVFGLDLGSDILALLALLTTVALVTTTLGFMLSALIKDITLMNMTTNLLVLVLAGIGGAIIPIILLPAWAQRLSIFTPHYWAMDGIQQIIILDHGLLDVLPQIAALLTFAAVFFTIGLFRFRFTD